jgi:hypothetical protein
VFLAVAVAVAVAVPYLTFYFRTFATNLHRFVVLLLDLGLPIERFVCSFWPFRPELSFLC